MNMKMDKIKINDGNMMHNFKKNKKVNKKEMKIVNTNKK